MKKRKKIIILSSLFAVVAILCTWITISTLWVSDVNNQPEKINYQTLADSKYRFEKETDNNESYAVLVGLTGALGNPNITGDMWSMEVPSTAQITTNGVQEELPVKKIDIPVGTSGQLKYPNWFSESNPNSFKNVGKIVVPKSVEFISYGAFNLCTDVIEVELPFVGTERGNQSVGTNGVNSAFLSIFGDKDFVTMSNYSFNFGTINTSGGNGTIAWYPNVNHQTANVKWLNVPVELKKVKITDEISVATHAFFQNMLVEEIDISFRTGIVNSTGALSFGDRVFDSCQNLVKVVLPTEISSYGDGIFSQCTSLTTVNLPYGIEAINYATFFKCNALNEIVIPSSVKYIKKDAFTDCSNLQKLYPSNIDAVDAQDGECRLPEAVEEIAEYAFRNCMAFTKMTVSSKVKSIGYMAFNGCASLTSITLPFIGVKSGNTGTKDSLFGYVFGEYGNGGEDSTDTILNQNICTRQEYTDADGTKNSALFYIPLHLNSVVIMNETVVGENAFMNCTMIETLELGSTITTITKGALKNCINLKSLTMPFVGPNNSAAINDGGHLGYIFGSEYTNDAIQVDISGTSYYIPVALETVTLTNQTTLKQHSFYKVSMIKNLIVGKATQSAERAVFTGNTQLESLTLPFVGIARGNFYHGYYWSYDDYIRNSIIWLFSYINAPGVYANLSIAGEWGANTWGSYIPETLTNLTITDENYIHTYAFRGFRSLETITLRDTEAGNQDTITHISSYCMTGCSGLKTLNLPFIGADKNINALNNYTYVLGWIFGNSAYTGSYAAYQAGRTWYIPNNLDSIQFGAVQTSIADDAFRGLKSITAVSSDAIISQLGQYAFANCVRLNKLDLKKANYAKVGNYAFLNDVGLSIISEFTPTTVNQIGHGGFMGTSIQDVDLTKYKYVGDYAFSNCMQLKAIDFTGSNLEYVGTHLFEGCKFLSDVKLSRYITAYMFKDCVSLRNLNVDVVMNSINEAKDKIIPDGFVEGCTNLKTANYGEQSGFLLNPLSSGVISIGANAFKGCKSITEMELPETLLEIKAGAFQNCTGLENLRIPRYVTMMPYGTRNGIDNYTLGIFYGCSDDFYLEVFYPEDEWFDTWGENWNCYFPVYIIGDQIEDIYTYEYSADLKGYLITGLNTAKYDFIYENATGTTTYLLQNSITFPSTHDGIKVYGLADNAFKDQADYLAEVNNFILGKNFTYMGNKSLIFGNRWISIYSCSSHTSTIDTLHIGKEDYYAERARIYYQAAWKLVGTTPVWTMDALSFELNVESKEYTYALGKAIKPEIINVKSNQEIIKFTMTYDQVVSDAADEIYNLTHDEDDKLDLNILSLQYKNNINVGTGNIIVTPSDSRLTGTHTISFKVIPYEIDLFYDSEKDPDTDLGFADNLQNEIFGLSSGDSYLRKHTYSGNSWSFSAWDQNTALYLPTGYKLVGKLETASANSGYYAVDKYNSPLMLMDENGELVVGTFKWNGGFKVYNPAGADVTRNFSCAISLAVQILPYEINEVVWPGTQNDGIYEYGYTGQPIIPVPTVKNGPKGLNPQFVIKVTPDEAIYPSNTTYTATIVGYDAHNFTLAASCVKVIQFRVVKADVYIDMMVKQYKILETEDYFSFSDFENWEKYKLSYNMNITGLGPNSYIDGFLRTSDWKKGLYHSEDTNGMTVFWGGSGYNIYSTSLDEQGDPIVETGYYNIFLNVSVEIIFQDFDYDLTLDTNNDQHLFKDAIGVKTFSADNNYIVYGTDGKDHVIQAFIRNTSSATVSFDYTTDSYAFKNTGIYTFNLSITKDKFNPININIQMNVVNGDYEFESLTKEYDRLAVDPISKLKRQPVDFQQEKIKFTYYNFSDTSLSSPLASAPSSIGKYVVVINTVPGHSVWFNDLENHKINFEITKRSLIIDVVDQVDPYDSKIYDGEAWKLVVNSITGVYNLLDGDMLTGSFISKSASIGTYYGQNAFGGSDFFCNSENGWVVNNASYGTVTSCYNIVFKGEYTILPREIQLSSSGGTYDYDGSYHSIEVNVVNPASNYQIYYSEKQVSIGPDGVDAGDWSIFPFYYSSPGEYTVYFKVVADTYETKYWQETVTINGKSIVYALADENAHYDGYPHGITVNVTDPWNAQISYAIVELNDGSIDFEQLSYTNVCPTFIEEGTYFYVVRITALNYTTVYETATLTIDDNGNNMGVAVVGWTGPYDALYHGPTFSNNLLSLDGAQVFYANGDSWNADTVWNTFFTVSNSTNLTQPLFIEAGTYDIVVKIMAKGYKISYTIVTIDIEELTLDLNIKGYSGVYNGEGHTGILSNPSGLLVTDDLIINGTTFENLKYTYKMMIGGTENVLDLDVYYSSVNNHGNPNSTTWTKTPIKFKDVGNYMLYVMIQAENCRTEYLFCQISITKNQNPEVTLEDFVIQYLGIPLPNSEVPVEAFHDGERIYVYQTYGGNAGGGLSYISNPTDLGNYKVTVTFLETNNCAGAEVSANFKIVPRELIIEYDDELEYTGMVQMPEVTATTGTDDEIIIVRAIEGTEQPIEVGNYEMAISMLYENPNYVIRLEDQVLSFKITKRKVYVTLKEEYDYNGTTPWQKNSNWYIYNHLGGDTFEANMETQGVVRGLYTLIGTYSYNGSEYEFNSTSSVFSYEVVCNTLAMKKADGTDAYYYDIVCDIQISIVYPPLEIEVADPTVYEYDGNPHSLEIKILSSGTGAITSSFWYLDKPGVTYPYLNEFEVGVYKIGYEIGATNFEPIRGEATLIIEQTELDIDIDEFSGIYDGENHDVTYKILNPGFTLPSSVQPKKFYFNVDILEEKNIKVSDIIKFFKEGCPTTSKVYDVWRYAPQHITDAGTYQSVVYFAETLNWVASVAVKEVTLDQRPLYFNNIGVSPLVLTKNYDGQKYIISLGDFEYDLSGKNNLPNAGLLSNHKIDNDQMPNYSIRTVSPNARGEIGNGDPYQNDGDFEFNSILISQGGSGSANLNFSSNYYPVINEKSIGIPALQVIIRRIALTVFDVEDYIHTYDGKDALPKISTPSDGELKYYYFKVDADHVRLSNTLYENQTDVGYYEVYITILEGTNYKAWVGDHVIDSVVNAAAPGYYFKKAYVQVVPKEVNVQWEESEVVYDGEDHFAKPYIMDVFGNKQLLDYNSYDEDGFLRASKEMHMAGSYGLEAYISGSSILNPNNYVFGDNTGTFTVLKRTYLVRERSKEPFLYTTWSKSYTEADFNDPDNDIYWLDGHELDLTISTATVTAGTFQNKGQFKIDQRITDTTGLDVSSCFLFDLDMKIILESRELVVEAEDVEVIFNNTDVYPKISVTSHNSGYNISYETVPLDFTTGALPNDFDEKSLKYPDSNPPSFRDVGRYRVYYRALIPAENAPSTGYADVWIQPDTSELHFSDSLSKTYDGIAVQVSSLQKSGKFNGNSNPSLLEYTWYNGHITPTAADAPMKLQFTPFEVGEYTLLVTCSADNNGSYAQNYAPLEAVFHFEITPAEITLVVNTDWEVNSAILVNNIWGLAPGVLTNVGSAPSEIYVDKLFGSDALRYEIKATENLARGTYTYTTGVAQTSGFLFSANGKEFSLDWSLYYQGTGTPDRTKNYNLKLVFNLNVHFPYMQVQSTEQTYTYATGVYQSPDIVVNMPSNSADYTIKYGDSSTTCTSLIYEKTFPGIYLAFFEITPNAGVDYEPYKGTNKFTIEYQERAIESVSSIGKTYDGTSVSKPTVTFSTATTDIEGIPNITTWNIEFYRAVRENINSPWYPTGDPFDTAIEVGDYIYKLTIPSGTLFGETVIENYFNIVQRKFNVDGTATPISFNGSNWEYDLVSNPEGLVITNLIPGDEIKSGVLVTSSMDAGTYSYNSQHGRYINFKDGYRIENADGEDVTINYGYNIDNVSVEIKKGTMYVTTTIPPSGIYTFNKAGVTPSAMCITPSNPDTFQYSTNGSTWKDTPNTYIGIGSFKMYIRATADNYEDFYMMYPFEVQMASDEISLMEEMSREYNGNPIDLPKIHTASGHNGVAQKEWVTYFDSSGSVMSTTPTNVGTYTAVISYPSTQNYAGTQISVDFEITPAKITLAWSDLNPMYDATSQSPGFNLSSVTYPTWVVKNDLVEGVHYKFTYYSIEDLTNPLGVKPINVGTYHVKIEFIGEAATNYRFTGGTIIEGTNYTIIPAEITIFYRGIEQYNAGHAITLFKDTDFTVHGLPAGINFTSRIVTNDGKVGTYAASGPYSSSNNNFSNKFVWSTGAEPIFQFAATGAPDSLANYKITLDIDLKISAGVMPYTVEAYEDVYDGEPHTFKFDISEVESDPPTIKYSIDGGNSFTEAKPHYTNAMTSPVRVVVQVITETYGSVLYGKDSTATDYEQFKIFITKDESEITNADEINLNKVYDGKAIVNPAVTYNGDLRDSYLSYEYFKLKAQSASGDVYEQVEVNTIIGVGKYCVKIKLKESQNYQESDEIEVFFEITPRKLVVQYLNQSKVYDGYVWRAVVSSDSNYPSASGAEVLGLTGVSESGLLLGSEFVGIIQTSSANAGLYKLDPVGDFNWYSEYKILDGTEDVTLNYEVILDLEVTISPAEFDVEAKNGGGIYDGITEYFISITWNTNPFVATSNLNELISYSLIGGINPDNYQSDPIGVKSGSKTIYVKIEAPNYKTLYTSALVIVDPMNSEITVTDFDGKAGDITYNGEPYDINSIEVTLNVGTDRTPYFVFYLSGSVTPLDAPPTNVGNYYFIVKVDEAADGSADATESGKCYFRIIPKEIEVKWTFDGVETDAGGNPVYKMIYTGSAILPEAEALAIDNTTSIPLKFKFLSPDGTDAAIIVGPYVLKASIAHDGINLYHQNYKLKNDTISFEVIPQIGGGDFIPDDAEEGDFPIDPNHPDYAGMTFPSPQGNPKDNGNPYTFGDDLWVTGIMHDIHGNSATYHFKTNANGEVITILVDSSQNQYAVQPGSFNFTVDFEDQKCPKSSATVILKDKNNTAWDSNGDTADKKIEFNVNQKPLDPTPHPDNNDPDPDHPVDPDNPLPPIGDIIIREYVNSHKWTGQPITFELEVVATNGTNATGDDTILVEGKDYEIIWFNNIDPTGDTVNSMASFVVKSLSSGGYSFELGDSSSTLAEDHAGRFTILTSEPTRLKLNADSKIQFVNVNQDFDANTISFDVMTFDERNTVLDALQPSEQVKKPIRLGHLYQGTTFADILTQFVNDKQYIRIYDKDDVLIYDGSDTSLQDDTQKITTGQKISLVDPSDPNQNLDVIELMLKGDTNGDGYININDVATVYENLSLSLENEDKLNTLYQAGILNGLSVSQNINDVSEIFLHIAGSTDINEDYKP